MKLCSTITQEVNSVDVSCNGFPWGIHSLGDTLGII